MSLKTRNSVATVLSALTLMQQGVPAYAQQPGSLVGGYDASFVVSPAVSASTYAAGLALGGLQTWQVFRTLQNPSGIVTNIQASSATGNTVAMTLYVFDVNPAASTCSNLTAFALNSADIPKLAFAPVTITPAVPQNSTAAIGQYQPSPPISVKNREAPATQNLYACLVPNATVTAAVSDLTLKLSLVQD